MLLCSTLPAFGAEIVAKAVFVVGQVRVSGLDGQVRQLQKGGGLYEGDTLSLASGAAAQILFRDQSRLALRPSTQMRIESFRYAATEPASDRALFRLLSGAMRSITGLLGQRNHDRVSVETPVATIGIRGTDFETVHVPVPAAAVANAPAAPPVIDADPGTYNKVYSGGTRLTTATGGTLDLGVNQVGFVGTGGQVGAPLRVNDLPKSIQQFIESAPVAAREASPGPGNEAGPNRDGDNQDGGGRAGGDAQAGAGGPAPADGGTGTQNAQSNPAGTTAVPRAEPGEIKATNIEPSGPVTATVSPTKVQSSTLSTTVLQPATATLSPSATLQSTTVLQPATTLAPATATLSPSATLQSTTVLQPATTLAPATATLSPSATLQSTTVLQPATTLAPATTTLSPTTTLQSTTMLQPATTLAPATTTLSPTTTLQPTTVLQPATTLQPATAISPTIPR